MSVRCRGAKRLLLGSLVFALGCFNSVNVDLGLLGRRGELVENVVLGERGPKLVLVEVSGVISSRPRETPLGLRTGPALVPQVRSILDRAEADNEVAGLVLRINSPGGSAAASETLHHEIRRWKEATGRPVVAFLNGLAASGGYYVAMASQEVIAHPTTVTGSI